VDVFALRDRLVADYEEFTRSFIHVKDDHIRDVVDRELAEGLLNETAAPTTELRRRGAGGFVAQPTPAISWSVIWGSEVRELLGPAPHSRRHPGRSGSPK
jgi:hypothetical protein